MIDPLELHAYADGQLEKADRDRIASQLSTDPVSAAQLESINSLKDLVRDNCHAVECGDEWKKCVGRIKELEKSNRAESFVSRYAWALCGVFFVAILVGGVFSRMNPSSGESSDLARVVATMSPTGGPDSREPTEMRRWLDRLVGAAAQSVSPERLDILGASSGELDGARAAKLVLQDRDGVVQLLMVNANLNLSEFMANGGYRVGQLQGENFIAWHVGDTTLVLVGNRPYDELTQFASTKIAH